MYNITLLHYSHYDLTSTSDSLTPCQAGGPTCRLTREQD